MCGAQNSSITAKQTFKSVGGVPSPREALAEVAAEAGVLVVSTGPPAGLAVPGRC